MQEFTKTFNVNDDVVTLSDTTVQTQTQADTNVGG